LVVVRAVRQQVLLVVEAEELLGLGVKQLEEFHHLLILAVQL
jgi:hypothetical protein